MPDLDEEERTRATVQNDLATEDAADEWIASLDARLLLLHDPDSG